MDVHSTWVESVSDV